MENLPLNWHVTKIYKYKSTFTAQLSQTMKDYLSIFHGQSKILAFLYTFLSGEEG